MTDLLRDQYEAYPYPARDPADERRRLILGSPSNLPEVNHYLFAGRRDFAQGFRALVGGGGTGDATIMLAQQLADAGTAGRVTYLDLSTASRRIAEARAKARGLKNITFLTGSLLDPPPECEGPFDYIDCCGVLHHLPDPLAGLTSLRSLLAKEGGMGLMLYAPLGRRGVYETQALLRQIKKGDSLKEQVEMTRRLLDLLPESNWLKRNPFVGDHQRSDAELVDLLLHSQDRAFSVEEVFDLVAGAGLTIAGFIEPARYDPATYIKDPVLWKKMEKLTWPQQAAFAERLAGNIKTHVFYVTTAKERSVADLSERGSEDYWNIVPLFRPIEDMENFGVSLASTLRKSGFVTTNLTGLKLRLPLPRLAELIVRHTDGTRSLGKIFQELKEKDSALEPVIFQNQFAETYRVLNGLNFLLLKKPIS
ncbi:MAG: class I SAM-dependent methyltransferase [Pseudomonadota bacterium]